MLLRCEGEMDRRTQEDGTLLGGEAQVRITQLKQLSPSTQACQTQRRISTGRKNDMQMLQMLNQKAQYLMQCWLSDHMIIVEKQQGRSLVQDQVDPIDQCRQKIVIGLTR